VILKDHSSKLSFAEQKDRRLCRKKSKDNLCCCPALSLAKDIDSRAVSRNLGSSSREGEQSSKPVRVEVSNMRLETAPLTSGGYRGTFRSR